MKLRGNCPAKVDEKGRLKIPAVFLEGLKEYGTQFYITSITGEDARIYPLSVWSEIEDRLAALPSQHEGKRKFLLRTSYYGQQVEVDGQGRLLLPGVLRESAQLKAEVDVFGELNILVVMNHTGLVDKMKNEPLTGDELTALGV
jgi:MraZ protein